MLGSGLAGCIGDTRPEPEPQVSMEKIEEYRHRFEQITLPEEVDVPVRYTGELEVEKKQPPRYIFTYEVPGRDLQFHGFIQGSYWYTNYEATIKELYAGDETAIGLYYCPDSYDSETGCFYIRSRDELPMVARAVCEINEIYYPEAAYHAEGYRMRVEPNVWVYLRYGGETGEKPKELRITKALVLCGIYGQALDETEVLQRMERDYEQQIKLLEKH